MAAPITSRTETLNKYLKLDQKGNLMAEYVWIDAEGNTRSKSRVSFLLFLVFSFFPSNNRDDGDTSSLCYAQ
jgi:hypothetical protein